MYKIPLMALLFIGNNIIAQNRVNKLSIDLLTNFYSYGEGQGYINNVVRLGEGFGLSYKTYDTVKRSGMTYELMLTNTTAYYQNVVPGVSVLEVNDLHANVNIIFPFLILYTNRIEHSMGAGIGISTLAERDYLDQNNNTLPYNSSNLKKIRFGHYWKASLILDYGLSLKFYRKIGINLGVRYFSDAPGHAGNATYKVTQGTGVGFKLGMFYQFK